MWQVIAVLCSIAADGHLGRCEQLVLPRNYATVEECKSARDRQHPSIERVAAAFAAHAGFRDVTLIVRCDVPPARA